jgi:hypothetical protein
MANLNAHEAGNGGKKPRGCLQPTKSPLLGELKSGVKFSPFIQIWLKTAHKHAKFMQQSMKASQSWLQPSSGFNL